MSYLGGIGGGRGPVPPAPNTQNRDLQEPPTSSVTIKSAKWGRPQALLNDPVPMQVLLSRPAINPTATIEIYFHPQGAMPIKVGNPVSIRIVSLTLIAQWNVKTPIGKDPYRGHYTFRVKIDNQIVRSNELRLTSDPISRVVQRNNTDGWDG